jgi:ribosomal protein L15
MRESGSGVSAGAGKAGGSRSSRALKGAMMRCPLWRERQKLEKKRSLSDQVIQADQLMRKQVTRDELLELVRLDEAAEK